MGHIKLFKDYKNNKLTTSIRDVLKHGYQTEVYCLKLVNCLDLKELKNINMRSFSRSAFLHDIGKADMSDKILMKPTKLTKKEYEVIDIKTISDTRLVNCLYKPPFYIISFKEEDKNDI